jgi:lysophospholipase L1-like esterase
VPIATFRANLQRIIQRLQQETDAAILVQSFLPEVRVPAAVLHAEAAYNAVVPAVCRAQSVGYEDLFNTFLALGRMAMANLRHDSEHPTAAGYAFMAAETVAVLQSSYLAADGTLIGPASAPGTDDLLPDNGLDSAPTSAQK